MNKSLRFIGLCVSLLVFVAFLGNVFLLDAKAQPEEVICPCRFDLVPITTECWDSPEDFLPIYLSASSQSFLICELVSQQPETPISAYSISVGTVMEEEVGGFCRISMTEAPPACGSQNEFHELTAEELKACQCELQAYVTALNEGGSISVTGGPPYTCGDVDCGPVTTTPIPTLSEWGLIAMAGILGIVGFMVIRRRKVTA